MTVLQVDFGVEYRLHKHNAEHLICIFVRYDINVLKGNKCIE